MKRIVLLADPALDRLIQRQIREAKKIGHSLTMNDVIRHALLATYSGDDPNTR